MGARSSEHTVNGCIVRSICTMYFIHIVYEYIIPCFQVFTVCTTFSFCVCVCVCGGEHPMEYKGTMVETRQHSVALRTLLLSFQSFWISRIACCNSTIVETYYIHEKLKKNCVINRLKHMIVNLISWNHQQINEGILSSPYPLFVIDMHT
jgi:hypothetical protein